ncbi:MAG: glutamate racemase [Candidatus Omnitrophica bacterium]|nr:glutamate racemase [Candidatus Omnitrophota bacterium]
MDTPIGIFDSGIGGLTVLKEVMKRLPNENIVYLGDTARVPYGTKSPNTVIKFSIENALFLLKFRVKLIIIACNTSSSYSLPVLKKDFKVPVIGVIGPGAEEAAKVTTRGRVGVIGTSATIQSGAYENEIKNIDPGIKVFSQACPLFVPLVEERWLNGSITCGVAKKYLEPLRQKRVDTLILGCTHYPLLKDVIRSVMGDGVALVDSARQVAAHAKEILSWENLLSKSGRRARCRFYVSDEPAKFALSGEKFIGRKIGPVKKVNGYV